MPILESSSGIWKRLLRPKRTGGRPYRVACPCGAELTGRRSPQARQGQCTRCGVLVFVLPESAWPQVEAEATAGGTNDPKARRKQRFWRAMAYFVAFGLIAYGCLTIAALRLAGRRASAQLAGADLGHRLSTAELLVRQHHWALAEEEAKAFLRDLGSAESEEAKRNRAAIMELLADLAVLKQLSPLPLAGIVREAKTVDYQAWAARWKAEFQGRQVVFTLSGEADLEALALESGEAEGGFRVDLGLTDEERLRLARPGADRCFALRLDSCRLEEQEGGGEPRWTLRFLPKSLALLAPKRFGCMGLAWLTLAGPPHEAAARREGRQQGIWYAFGYPNQEPDDYSRAMAEIQALAPGFVPREASGQCRQVWERGFIEHWLFTDVGSFVVEFEATLQADSLPKLVRKPLVRKPAAVHKE